MTDAEREAMCEEMYRAVQSTLFGADGARLAGEVAHEGMSAALDVVLSRLQRPVGGEARERWYLGSLNDGLFIIDTPPRPSTDDAWHDRPDGPGMALNVVTLSEAQAQAVVDAHNRSRAQHDAEVEALRRERDEASTKYEAYRRFEVVHQREAAARDAARGGDLEPLIASEWSRMGAGLSAPEWCSPRETFALCIREAFNAGALTGHQAPSIEGEGQR